MPGGLLLFSRISGVLSFRKSLFLEEIFLRFSFRILFLTPFPSYPYHFYTQYSLRWGFFFSGEEVPAKIRIRIFPHIQSGLARSGLAGHKGIRSISWDHIDRSNPNSIGKTTSGDAADVPYHCPDDPVRKWGDLFNGSDGLRFGSPSDLSPVFSSAVSPGRDTDTRNIQDSFHRYSGYYPYPES